MHFRRVLFTTLVWVSFIGCLQQGGPTGTSPSGGSPGGGFLNPGGTTGSANPGSSIVDPLGSSIDGGTAAATQDPASVGASPDATQATPPDRPPSTAVPDPVLRPPHVINVGPSRPREEEGNGDDGDSEGQTLGERIAEQQRQEMQQRQEEHEEFQNRIGEALQAQGLGMQEPASEEEAASFPIVSVPLTPAGGQILQRESFPYPNIAPNNSNTPQQRPNIPLGVNLGNGQQQFPAMRQP